MELLAGEFELVAGVWRLKEGRNVSGISVRKDAGRWLSQKEILCIN